MMDFEECLREGYLKRINPNKDAAEKELKSAGHDITRAKVTLESSDEKWAIVQAYYSMFHAAKALLFSFGLKERSHSAVQAALEELSKKGIIESAHAINFAAAKEARENSDYRHVYSKDTAEDIIEYAEEFLYEIDSIINKLKSEGKRKDR